MRRFGRSFVLLLMAIGAVGAGASSVIALSYHRFSTDVRKAQAPVPAAADTALSPAAGTLDRPQVIMVRASGRAASGAVVLLRTVPNGRATAFLSVPGSALLAGEPISRLDTPGLIRGLRATMGIGISHVAIINLSTASRLIATPGSEHHHPAEQDVLRAVADQAVAPKSLIQLPATGRAIAETATDLTAADVLSLVWTRLDDRRVIQCSFAGHQTIDSAQGRAIAAAFLARDGDEPVSACRAKAIAGASFVPPKAVLAIVAHHGAWVFIEIAVAAMLMSLGAAALFARMRFGATTSAPVTVHDVGAADPASSVGPVRAALAISPLGGDVGSPRLRQYSRDLGRAWPGLAGAGVAVRRAIAGATAKVHVLREGLVRAAETIAAVRRVGHERVSAIREGAFIGGRRPARSAYRSRVRRFVYMHQDAIWIGLCAAVATGILARLLSS
jgi:hypothetical protein